MGGGGRRCDGGYSSSSGEEDGDADWRAAINSVASDNYPGRTTADGIASSLNGSATKSIGGGTRHDDYSELDNQKPQKLKHYQIKAQKLLDDILEKTIVVVRDPVDVQHDGPMISGTGVRLFRDAPPGIVFDHTEELQGPTKKPRIRPGKEIDEKSKTFKRQLQSVAVDGVDIIAAARKRHQKSLAKLEGKDAAAKAAAKKEDERVAELKKIRGERWLPSIARDMQVKFRGC